MRKKNKNNIFNTLIVISVLAIISGVFMACIKTEVAWFELQVFGLILSLIGGIGAIVFGVIRGISHIEF